MTYDGMRTYVCQETRVTEWFSLRDIADMYFYHRYFTILDGIAQRHAGMRIASGVQHDAVALVIGHW